MGLSPARRYASAVFAVERWLSVRLSVTRLYCVEMAKTILKLFRPSDSPISSFFIPRADTQFQGEPRQRERKVLGDGKNCNFQLNSPFISETVRDMPMVTMER